MYLFSLHPHLYTGNFICHRSPSNQPTKCSCYLQSTTMFHQQSLPHASFVRIGLGEHINLVDAEYLLGKAVNSSGPIQVGRTRVEQIMFNYGTITTIDNHISTIKVYPRIVNGKNESPDIENFAAIGWPESKVKESCGNPNTIIQNEPSVKTFVYTNTVNYVLLDIDNDTRKVISYEIGFEQSK